MPNRFVIKFSKTGYSKYTSHLDLLRVFKRTFSIADIKLKYSQGFNPHPKMVFAQPLSLGYASKCELIEFETRDDLKPDEILERMKGKVPEGVELLGCKVLEDHIKTLCGETESARYKIWIPTDFDESKLVNLLREYLAQDEILALKKSKKTKELKEVSIKPMIRELTISKLGEFAMIDALLDSGSISNLSPELIIQTFVKFAGIEAKRYECEVERTGLYFVNNFQF